MGVRLWNVVSASTFIVPAQFASELTYIILGDMPALGVVSCDKPDPHTIAFLQNVKNATKETATKKRKAAQMDRLESSKAGSSD
jgi:hypothetical protein